MPQSALRDHDSMSYEVHLGFGVFIHDKTSQILSRSMELAAHLLQPTKVGVKNIIVGGLYEHWAKTTRETTCILPPSEP